MTRKILPNKSQKNKKSQKKTVNSIRYLKF